MYWKRAISVVVTLLIFGAAVFIVRTLWMHYMDTPWTRDGRVRADVVNIAPDVAGLVNEVLVRDNQFVKKGDLLMRIDTEHYQMAVKRAEALVASRKATMEMRLDNAKRRADMSEKVVSRESRSDADQMAAAAAADYREAQAQLDAARLDLRRSDVHAPTDGYITNLQVFKGDFTQRGQAAMALVDSNSFYVNAYMEETRLPLIRIGDKVDLRLMSGENLTGSVESISRGIYDRDNPESRELIADVNPTFNWVRLAQRVPVRVHLDQVPEGVVLSAGITCTVVVHSSVTGPHPRPDRW